MRSSFVRGFTVVELMIAVAIFAIIVSIGVPSFQSLVANNRLTSVTNQLVGDLHYARSEALKLRQDVTLCRSASPA
ncbi:MAG TPA: GspH/FimT family pseudopilin, partial [Gammaproteobacteria bacterium]|nr:GspH/FimT family pseudopilin [Gammaproteobacteria bacterium]